MEKTVSLPKNKGTITYRLPNVIEQLRFFSDAKWYAEDSLKDFVLRTARGLEASRPFIIKVEGEYKSFEELIEDRENLNALWDMVNDLGGIGKQVTEDEKKPSGSAPST